MYSMRTYEEARKYSKQNPDELVKFSDLCSDNRTTTTGAFLNGEPEGIFEYFYDSILHIRVKFNSKTSHAEHVHFSPDGCVSNHFFKKNKFVHGEYIKVNVDGTVRDHNFVVDTIHIKELNYLLDAERDDAFYVTLALYGIDKEYTIGAV